MPGYPDHDTVFSSGDIPKFGDVRDFGYLRSPTLLRKLSTARLEFRVFDDGEQSCLFVRRQEVWGAGSIWDGRPAVCFVKPELLLF